MCYALLLLRVPGGGPCQPPGPLPGNVVMLVVVRWLGRRMKGQLSIGELAVILTLGAMIAGSLQLPTAGLLPSVVILLAVLGMHRLTNWLVFKYRPVELALQGDLALLVRNGCLELATMRPHALSQEQLFGLLRNEKIAQLGELKRVYLEANGRLSYYRLAEPKPGLIILPRPRRPCWRPKKLLRSAAPRSALTLPTLAWLIAGLRQMKEDKRRSLLIT